MRKELWILGLLLLAGCVQPFTPGQYAQEGVSSLFQAWIGVAGVLLMISLGIMLLAYIFGNILANEKVKAWAKMELFEIIYSVIILVMALYATQAATDVVDGLTHGSDQYTDCICSQDFIPANVEGTIYYGIQECHIRLALYFLHTIFREAREANRDIYLSYIVTATIADAQLTMENVMEPAGMFTFTPWRGLLAMGNLVKQETFNKYVIVMLVTMFQEILVRFIATTFYPVVFVLGVILRAFTFTRRLGGLLMALALSLFFIYPMFYAFGALIVNQIKIAHATPDNPDPPIAHLLYVNGTIPMLTAEDPTGQGRLGTLDLGEERRRSREALEMNACQGGVLKTDKALRELAIESAQATGSVPLPRIYDQPPPPPTIEEQMEGLRRKADEWLGEASKRKWYDVGVLNAFEDGGIIDILSRLMFFSVFFGLLGILATIAAVKNLSVLLGGDTELAGLTHLI